MGHLLAFTEASTTDAGGGIVAILAVVVVSVIVIAYFVWYIWLLLDMSKQPDGAWQASGQTKSLWQILWVIGFCIGGGLIIGLLYQFMIRPKVLAAAGPV